MNKKISVIVFDLGNVLLPFNYSNTLERLEKIEENLGHNFLKFYRENYHIHRGFESGKISEEEFTDIMLKALKNKITKDEFYKYYSEIFTVNQDVVDLLPELKKNYMLVLLSNTNSIHKKYGWQKNSFLKFFDKLILSHEVGAVKPETEIYHSVENSTQRPPEEHIFIDDIKEYAEAAKNLGWDAIQFTGYENLLTELKKRNIIFDETHG